MSGEDSSPDAIRAELNAIADEADINVGVVHGVGDNLIDHLAHLRQVMAGSAQFSLGNEALNNLMVVAMRTSVRVVRTGKEGARAVREATKLL